MATSKKAQSKAGIPARRRGQQMGDERSQTEKTTEVKKQTPVLRGRLKSASKFFADDSSQTIASGGDGSPSDNSPSVSAAVPTSEKLGESGGEKSFTQRQKAKVKRQK
jgi:hypothetical protein